MSLPLFKLSANNFAR